MKIRILLLSLAFALPVSVGCEKKTNPDEEEEGYEEEYEEEAEDETPQHIDTNRAGFQAAGRAKDAIEGKQADRNSAADEAMKAGQ